MPTEKNNEEAMDLAQQIVDEHNIALHGKTGANYDKSFWSIGLTGDHRNMYTLYCVHVSQYAGVSSHYTYMKNLGTDILECVRKICTKKGMTVVIDLEPSRDRKSRRGNGTIPFGKYTGKTMSEVYEENPNYVLWFANNFSGGAKHQHLVDESNEFKAMHYQMITEKNLAESVSNFVGVLKVRSEFTLVVKYIKESTLIDGHFTLENNKYTCEDLDGNKINFYGNIDNIKVGDTVKVKATPVNHNVVLGCKTTRLNRVVLIK